MIIADKSSFASMYEEIFTNKIYEIKTEIEKPLIIDCGSNIGLSILFFKQNLPNAKVIGFEPDPRIFNILKGNIESAKLSDIQLINKALSDKEGKIDFYSEGADGGRIAQENDNKIISVDTIRLRPYLDKEIDLLKIDIEGAETAVLKDCADLLKNVKNIFIEYHSIKDKDQTLDEILKILRDNNFRYYIDRTGIKSTQPFLKINTNLNYDLQLNISATKQK